MALDADGDFVVTWTSYLQDGSGTGIYAQRYNAAGVAQGVEFRVNTHTADNQRYSTVAMDAAGDFVVTWQSTGQDAVNSDGIYAQRYNAAGVAQGGEFPVNTTTANNQQKSTVALDAAGDFVVTWSSYLQDGGRMGVYAQRYNAAGVAQGGEFPVNTTTANSQRSSTVALDAAGDFVVTWMSYGQDGSGYGIYAQRYQQDGPVQLIGTTLAVTGTALADIISVTSATPAGGAASLIVTRNGVISNYDPAKVTVISIDGLNGDNRLSIGGNVTLSATLNGGSGQDTLTGGGGNDTLNGGGGNDSYLFDTDLALGSDTINEAGGGTDTLDFSTTTTRAVAVDLSHAGPQFVNAGLTLALSSGTTLENVLGGSLGDTLTGNTLANTLTGGAGNDSYLFDTDLALGSDTVNEAGGGTDTLDFSTTTTRAVTIDLSSAAAQVVNAGLMLTLSANNTLENVVGGSLGNTLIGNTLNNVLVGGISNDTLTGAGGNDSLDGGAGNDTYAFNTNTPLNSDTVTDGAGIDQLSFVGSTTAVAVSLGLTTAQTVNGNLTLTLVSATALENVTGGSGNDILTGNSLNNTLIGGAGNDNLYGAAGNDTYAFNTNTPLNSDTVTDGVGIDQLSFIGSTTAVTVSLGLTTAQTVNANLMLTLASATALENVYGGSGNDILTGNSLNNLLVGGAGNDRLYGAAGNDTYAFNTNTPLNSDTVYDGAGIDQLSFVGSTAAVAVNLGLTTAQTVNANLTLTLASATAFENVTGGSGNDILIGNTLNNILIGGDGNDVLTGGDGTDVLTGGNGKNILIGGNGLDALTGGSTEDLLLGARYINEGDTTALAALLTEWTSANSFDDRVAHLLGTLAGGANGGFTLTPTTVKEDAAQDTLTGGSGKDWYLRNSTGLTVANRDTISDADLDSVFTEISTWL